MLKIKSFSVRLLNVIIHWHGGGCYKVSSSTANIIIDPHTVNGAGSRLKGDLMLKTNIALPIDVDMHQSDEIVIAGEYEISGVKIKGIQVFSSASSIKNIYKVIIDNINLGFLGDIDFELNENTLDELGEIDILFVPSNNMASKLIKLVEPNIAIPGWGDPQVVITAIGHKPEPQEKLVIKKKDIEIEKGFRLVVLKS